MMRMDDEELVDIYEQRDDQSDEVEHADLDGSWCRGVFVPSSEDVS